MSKSKFKSILIAFLILVQPILAMYAVIYQSEYSLKILQSVVGGFTNVKYAKADEAAKDGYMKPIANLGFANKTEFDKTYSEVKSGAKKSSDELKNSKELGYSYVILIAILLSSILCFILVELDNIFAACKKAHIQYTEFKLKRKNNKASP